MILAETRFMTLENLSQDACMVRSESKAVKAKSRLDDQVDQEIQEKLTSTTYLLINLNRTKIKHPGKKGSDMIEALSIKEESEKIKQICSSMCLGFRSIVQDLEKDKLRLLLLSQSTQPSDLKRVLLTLVATRKNNEHGEVFDDFVQFASKYSGQISLPYDTDDSPAKGDNSCSSHVEDKSSQKDEENINVATMQNMQKFENEKTEAGTFLDEVYRKYYIPVIKSEKSSTFANQDFTSFGDENSESSVLVLEMRA